MRRIRSESWTFIWQPKVLIHAVLVDAASVLPPGRTAGTGVGARDGFLTSGIGVMFLLVWVILLILFLRFIDLCFQDSPPRARLDANPRDTQEPSPPPPPQDFPDLVEILAPHREYRCYRLHTSRRAHLRA